MTLAVGDTKSILNDNANREQGNPRQCGIESDSTWWPNLQLCKWPHQVTNFVTNASGAKWWQNLELMKMASSGDQSWNQWCL